MSDPSISRSEHCAMSGTLYEEDEVPVAVFLFERHLITLRIVQVAVTGLANMSLPAREEIIAKMDLLYEELKTMIRAGGAS